MNKILKPSVNAGEYYNHFGIPEKLREKKEMHRISTQPKMHTVRSVKDFKNETKNL